MFFTWFFAVFLVTAALMVLLAPFYWFFAIRKLRRGTDYPVWFMVCDRFVDLGCLITFLNLFIAFLIFNLNGSIT